MGDWFERLFGFTEESKAVVHEFLQVKGSSMQSLVNDAKFNIGTFSTPSLAELRARNQGNLEKFPGQLRVSILKGDVSAFMAEEANRHAVFQVASQFNCLEFPGPRTTPEQGVTNYVFDKTQGPCCSIACGAGTVYRNYFVPISLSSQTTQLGQSKAHQLNNLKDISLFLGNEEGVATRSPRRKTYAYFDSSAGYTMATREGLAALNAKLQSCGVKGVEKAKSLLKIGIQTDVQVTSKNWGNVQVRKKLQTVTQVFGSACSVAYSEGSAKSWAPFASLILDASYEATLWIALESALRHSGQGGSNKVFLTLLGGGVFGNSFDWIANAIGKAVKKFTNTGLDVRIVFYGPVCNEVKMMIKDYNDSLVKVESEPEEKEEEDEGITGLESDEETFRTRRRALRSQLETSLKGSQPEVGEDDNWTEVDIVEAKSEDYVELTSVITSSIAASPSTASSSLASSSSSSSSSSSRCSSIACSYSSSVAWSTRSSKSETAKSEVSRSTASLLPPVARTTRSRSPNPTARSLSPRPATRSLSPHPIRSLSPTKLPKVQPPKSPLPPKSPHKLSEPSSTLNYGNSKRKTAQRRNNSPRRVTRKTLHDYFGTK
jgi:hypothetical protein